MSKKIIVFADRKESTIAEIESCREICKKAATVNGKIDSRLIDMSESLFWTQVAMMDERDALEQIEMLEMGAEIEVTF